MTAAEHKWDFKITIDTPYLALTGEVWGVYCEDLGENWLRCYNDSTLYLYKFLIPLLLLVSFITANHQP